MSKEITKHELIYRALKVLRRYFIDEREVPKKSLDIYVDKKGQWHMNNVTIVSVQFDKYAVNLTSTLFPLEYYEVSLTWVDSYNLKVMYGNAELFNDVVDEQTDIEIELAQKRFDIYSKNVAIAERIIKNIIGKLQPNEHMWIMLLKKEPSYIDHDNCVTIKFYDGLGSGYRYIVDLWSKNHFIVRIVNEDKQVVYESKVGK